LCYSIEGKEMVERSLDSPGTFRGNAPASDAEIDAFAKQSGITLPEEYVCFLRKMNGGTGFVGSNYVDLWAVDTLIEYNRGYGAGEFVPELLLLGSDGGGQALAFDRRNRNWPVIMVPFIPLDIREAVIIAPSFDVLFGTLAAQSG
jgi:hypothetical protein